MLGDIARLLGHELNRDEHLSDVSCLTCAKLLAKTHASISKLFTAEARYSQRASGKRQSNARSPTGVTPSAKRAPAAVQVHVRESTTPKSRRFLALGNTDKENTLRRNNYDRLNRHANCFFDDAHYSWKELKNQILPKACRKNRENIFAFNKIIFCSSRRDSTCGKCSMALFIIPSKSA